MILVGKQEPHGEWSECYRDRAKCEVVADVKRGMIPDEALLNSFCWRWICKVRCWWLSQVDPETWEEICRKRGYLHSRQYPRVF